MQSFKKQKNHSLYSLNFEFLLSFFFSLLLFPVTVPGLTTAKGFALALQANDPHTKDFTLAILHLHESYFLEKLRRKWWEISHGCPAEIEASMKQS